MTKVITSAKDKDEILTLLKIACQVLLFNGTTPEQRVKLTQHIEWLQRNLTDFNVDTRFESDQFKTEITMTLFHGAGKITQA